MKKVGKENIIFFLIYEKYVFVRIITIICIYVN